MQNTEIVTVKFVTYNRALLSTDSWGDCMIFHVLLKFVSVFLFVIKYMQNLCHSSVQLALANSTIKHLFHNSLWENNVLSSTLSKFQDKSPTTTT